MSKWKQVMNIAYRGQHFPEYDTADSSSEVIGFDTIIIIVRLRDATLGKVESCENVFYCVYFQNVQSMHMQE